MNKIILTDKFQSSFFLEKKLRILKGIQKDQSIEQKGEEYERD